jgi:folate-binding protein YgfZ
MAETAVTLAVLRFRGPDAASFLQGQLSNDVESLADGALQLAGYHNPQGRVIALLRLARLGREELLAQLPQELAGPVAARLRRFVLRSRLSIELLDTPAAPSATRSRSADIAAGLPQVYLATSEKFVAQMLNLDCVGAVSFTKGCYAGQEIIARAHYRGRMKRRMQRFATRDIIAGPDAGSAPASASALRPGGSIRLPDGRRLELVDAVVRADGHVEFLAVAPLPAAADAETALDAAAGARAEPADAGVDSAPLLDCEALPLPYALPE